MKGPKRIYKIEIKTLEGEEISIEDSNMSFSVKKVRHANPDPATIIIKNLSKETRRLLEKPFDPKIKPGADLQLWVGYEHRKQMDMIYSGEVQEGLSYLLETEPTYETSLLCATGYHQIMNIIRSGSYDSSVDAEQMIKSIAAALGKKVEITTKVINFVKKRFINGRTFTENIHAFWEELQEELGINITETSDGPFQVTAINEPNDDETEKLNERTGLLGSRITHKGVEFVSEMNTRIRPGTLIYVESVATENYSKEFVCEEVNYTGDYEGDQWSTSGAALFYPPRF